MLLPNQPREAMKLLTNHELEHSPVVANCRMNRERRLHGSNGYDRELRFDPLEFLKSAANEHGQARWLDLCCGTGTALVEAAEQLDADLLPVTITGIDLAGMFCPHDSLRLQLVEGSLFDWRSNGHFDLITCVHGLHYIGNKLGIIARAVSWLTHHGRFAANLDPSNLHLRDGSSTRILSAMRQAGFSFSSRHKLLQCRGSLQMPRLPRYLGADDQAGPNYTGQPAVNSHYE